MNHLVIVLDNKKHDFTEVTFYFRLDKWGWHVVNGCRDVYNQSPRFDMLTEAQKDFSYMLDTQDESMETPTETEVPE